MFRTNKNSIQHRAGVVALALGMILVLLTTSAYGEKKKKQAAAEKPKPIITDPLFLSRIVWPNPPAITRIRYLNYFCAQKPPDAQEKKAKWMDRLAGVAVGETAQSDRRLFQLVTPYGLGVDSKNRLYVADTKVHAVFIFNTETKDLELIKNGMHARFALITGLVIDDSDRLFVSDSEMRHVLVFDPQHRVESSISEGMASPAGLAIDNENRFLYVADPELDQVLVYDADPPHKLLRKLGTAGKAHALTTPGDFAKPTNVAVDKDGNLYVSDTFNDRVESFDADGNFIRTFGKAGDGPGYFARPKGIAVDKDGHVWVADGVQDRVQVFTPEGELLIWMGGHGSLPGQFNALAGLTIDKNNRIFTSEQYAGRVQMFRYVTDEEALAERDRRKGEEQKKGAGKSAPSSSQQLSPAVSGKEAAARTSAEYEVATSLAELLQPKRRGETDPRAVSSNTSGGILK
ncbi:MAG: SMP-30/gluconolactonase/LRE family protein [Acidobacteriia bacterium]|nr:SMP-30/gluconolactonase/LRE family protein [Terriglobia bacterium]